MSNGPSERPMTLRTRALVRTMHLVWRVTRGMTLGVRAAVLDESGRVFLIRHTYTPGWYLPGGGVEPGETALDALTRELAEEALVVPTAEPALHGVFFNRTISPRDHVVCYVVRDFRMLGEKRPDREIAESGFFSLDALPEGTTGATRRRLAEILDGRERSAEW